MGKYMFKAYERLIDEFKENSLIEPCGFRYGGMGHYQVLANVVGHPGMAFNIIMGGPNGFEQADNHDKMLKLTVTDAIDIEELESRLIGDGYGKNWP